MSTIKIRFARADDIPKLEKMMFDLHDEHHMACPEYFKTAQEVTDEKNVHEYLHSPEGLIFTACEENELIGFVTGHFSELVSMVSKSVMMGSIDELYVAPPFRGQGAGRSLLQRIIREFEDYGIEQVFVEVWAFNQGAQKLYHQLGFAHHIHWLRKSVK